MGIVSNESNDRVHKLGHLRESSNYKELLIHALEVNDP